MGNKRGLGPGQAPRKTILLVEDEAIVAADESRLLKGEGYAVLIAASAKKAIETVNSGPGAVDLILMDIDLGKGMDGAQAAQAILKEHDIPIVFLSSHTEKEIVEKTEKITSYGYVVKDSGITVLSASIRMAFKLHHAHRELERHEEALRESQERFSNAFEHAAIGMALISPEGRWLKVNHRLCTILGYSEAEMLAKTFQETTHPDDLEASLAPYRGLLAGDTSSYHLTKRYLHKKGSVIWAHLTVSAIRDKAGRPLYFIAQIQDITERKRAEESLREMSEMFRLIMEHSPIYVFIKDRDIRPIYLSRNYETMLGRPLSEILGRTMDDLSPSELSRSMIADDQRILREGKPVNGIIEVFEGRTYSTTKFPILIDGVPRYLAGYTVDITDQTKAEAELHQSRDLLAYIISHARSAIAVLDRDMRYIFVSGQFLREYQVHEKNVIGRCHYELFPDLPEKWKEAHRRGLAGEVVGAEQEPYIRPDGTTSWGSWECRPWFESGGAVGGIILSTEIISERVRAKEALRESESRYRSLFEHMEEGVAYCRMVFDEQGHPTDFVYLTVNPAFERLTGLKDVEGRPVTEVIPGIKEQTPELLEAYGRVASTGRPEKFEINFTPLGVWLSVSVYCPGKGHVVAVFDNITERKKAEEEIKSAQLLLKSSIESPQQMIVLSIDRQHRYLYFNKWHREVMRAAYGRDVRIGMDLLECITNEEDRRKARLNYDRALDGEAHSTIEEYGDLERLYYETFYSPISNERGEIIGATAFARDVTDRKRAEEALKESIRQKEILMKELQHRVKNSLAVVSGLLGLGIETLTDEPSKSVLADTRSRIRSIASLYEQLSGTADAAHVDLGSYIGRLAGSLFDTYAPKTGNIRLRTELGEVTLETKRAVLLGLILNELVTNSIKYAYPAGAAGEIRIGLERSAGRLSLRVEDDGPGFPEKFDPETSGGMGWSLIRMLADELDARVSIERGRGCRVSLVLDLKEA